MHKRHSSLLDSVEKKIKKKVLLIEHFILNLLIAVFLKCISISFVEYLLFYLNLFENDILCEIRVEQM